MLNSNQKHLLRLAVKGANADGWTAVSPVIWPYIAALPDELIELRPAPEGGGHCRLTLIGQTVMKYV